MFFGIPLMMPEGVLSQRDLLMQLGIYNSGVCLFIIFNLGSTFGQAFNSCKSGLQGSLVAAILGWLMYTIFPEGVQHDHPDEAVAWWGGVAVGAIFVSLLLCLRRLSILRYSYTLAYIRNHI